MIKFLKKVNFKQFEDGCWPSDLQSFENGYGRVNSWEAPVINNRGVSGHTSV